MRYRSLSIGTQTAYAGLFEQTQGLEIQRHPGNLAGSFQRKRIKSRWYWYFAYRDIDGGMRFVYVGPAGADSTGKARSVRCPQSHPLRCSARPRGRDRFSTSALPKISAGQRRE